MGQERRFQWRGSTVILAGEDLIIDDNRLDEAASEAASTSAMLADLLADAVQAHEVADADYRHWRAARTVAAANGDEGGKAPAEWKVKAIVEADVGFMVKKNQVAEALSNLEFLTRFFEANRQKVQMISAKCGMKRTRIGNEAGAYNNELPAERAARSRAKKDEVADGD